MNDKLRVITIIKEINNSIYKALLNVPKEHLELKRIVIKEFNNLIKDIYIANDISNINRRKELKEEIICNIKYINYLIELLYEYKLISYKRSLEINEKMEVELRLLKGWIKI